MKPALPLGPEATQRKGRHVVAISGGKDSVAMALLLRRKYPEIPLEFVITPTGDELPEMIEHWRKLEAILGAPLRRLPCSSLKETIARNRALPNFRMRFCTRDIKIIPFMEYMDSLPNDSVLYVGLRVDERDRTGLETAANDTYRLAFPFQWPSVNFGLLEVQGLLVDEGINIPRRTDCARCFFQSIGEWHTLFLEHSAVFVDACFDEFKLGHTYRSPKRDTWPASLVELANEFTIGRKVRPYNRKPQATNCFWCAR